MPTYLSRLISGVLLATVMGCSFGNISKLRDGTTLREENFTTTIPFVTKSRLQVVTVYVEGVPLEFIWDTGASYTVLTAEGAAKINAEEVGSNSIRDSQGNVKKSPLVLIPEVKLGDLHFEEVLAAVIDYPENSAVRCVAYDGILGQNAIRRAQWTSDYTTNTFTVTDQPLEAGEGDLVASFSQNRRPLVTLNVGDKTVSNILLDTGSGGAIDLPADVKDKLNDDLFLYPELTYIDGTSQGVFGAGLDTSKECFPKYFAVDSVEVPGMIISFQENEKGKIGQQVLRMWDRVSLDHINQQIIFHGAQKKAKEPKSFWLGLSKSGDYITVGSLLEEHLNHENGLRRGDTLTALNGVPLPDFKDYCEFYEWQLSTFRGEQDSLQATMIDGKEVLLTKSLPLFPIEGE
ncbi:MAG: hypothetical protein SchgKO_13020 [Schleiferiaceae bacterium]